eukprot:UN31184
MLFCSKARGPSYLIKVTSKITAEYVNSLQAQLTKGPQIFYYDAGKYMEEKKKHSQSYSPYNRNNMNLPSGWENMKFSSSRKMEHIWFEQKELFLNAYDNFLNNQDDYERRGDPYTFSALLYGTPGCGKTSLIKACINKDREAGIISHLFVVQISKVQDIKELRNIMFNEKVGEFTIPLNRRIYIFEDFDAAEGADIFINGKL